MVFALAFSRTDGDGMPLYSASDTVKNERRTFENTDGWRPRNVGGKYSKTISLASALAHSSNIGTASCSRNWEARATWSTSPIV